MPNVSSDVLFYQVMAIGFLIIGGFFGVISSKIMYRRGFSNGHWQGQGKILENIIPEEFIHDPDKPEMAEYLGRLSVRYPKEGEIYEAPGLSKGQKVRFWVRFRLLKK